MFRKHSVKAALYLATSAIGLITAWTLNALAVFEEADYLAAWFGSTVDWVLSVDLLVVGAAVAIFMISEARRLGMKRVWLYFLLSGITAIAFTFPLFMFFRERKLLSIRLGDGKLQKFEFDNHRVDVWVPKTLNPKTPIVIMHDGKNLLDELDSFTEKTWEVIPAIRDEVRGEKPLVIGVWGLSDETRIRELSPQEILDRHPEFWDSLPDEYKTTGTDSFGDAYVSLLADAVLPFVFDRYEVEHDPDRTAVMGASMGGLISLYAMSKRPEIFGTAICFSTHWLLGRSSMVNELTGMLPTDGRHRIWTDSGTKELDEHYPPLHLMAAEVMRSKGYTEPDLLVANIYPYTGHHESYWSRRVADALNWWLRAPGRDQE